MKYNAITIAVLTALISSQNINASPTYSNNGNPGTPQGYKTYWPSINIGSCSLTNIKQVSVQNETTDPDGGNRTGTFALTVASPLSNSGFTPGTPCNIPVFLDPENQLQNVVNNDVIEIKRAGTWNTITGINPYTTQRNGSIYGSITEDSNGNLTFKTARANGYAISVQAGGILETKADLTIITNNPTDNAGGTTSGSLIVDGTLAAPAKAIVNGNLNINQTRTPFNDNDYSRAIRVVNGTLTVEKDLTVEHNFWVGGVDTSKGHGPTWELDNGTIDVKGNAILTNNLSSAGIRLANSSKLLIANNLDITMNKLVDWVPNAISSKRSLIDIDGNLTITGDNHILINQEEASTLNIHGSTELTKTEIGDYIQNDNSTINFYHTDLTFIGDKGQGIRNTNNGQIFFTQDQTQITANTLDKAIVNNNGTLHFLGNMSSIIGSIDNINNGVMTLQDGKVTGRLNITGTYTGGGSQATSGILKIDTKLASDNKPDQLDTDFITIGGKASGSTELQVVNAGGAGAKTYQKGIHIIQTDESDDGAFFIANGGYVTAGAYDYGLFLDENNWYLRSHRNDGGGDPAPPVYTPDVGEYLAAETMGNTLFTSRLEDREGASQYQNLGNTNKDVGNVWVRAYGNHNKFKTMDSQLKTTGNSFVTQIGAGLVTLGEEDQYNLGAMTGFAYYDGKTRSSLTDRESKTKIDGYSLGLYGTWYAHPVEKRGAYIDSWVLWNKFNNKIDTPDQNQYKYDSSGMTASIEVGGDYLINKNGKKDWWIQPQAQLIYQGVHADDFKDAQGVNINHGRDNVQARMGVKTYLEIPTNNNKLTSYRPYVALNFIHNTNPYSVVIDDVRYENEGSSNLGEVKVGIEGNVTKNSQVWLNASYVAGSHSNQAYQGNIGWKYNF